jgi:hypothetical protein
MPEIKEDDVVNAIRWKLGIPVDSNTAQHQSVWAQLLAANDPIILDKMHRVGRKVADLLARAVERRLEFYLPGSPNEAALLDALWAAFAAWLNADSIRRSPETNRLIKEAIARRSHQGAAAPPAVRTPPSAPARAPQQPANTPTPPRGVPPTPPAPTPIPPALVEKPAPTPPPASPPAAAAPQHTPTPAPPPAASGNDMQQPSDPPRPRPAVPQWNYRPVPRDEPDEHTEYDQCDCETTDGGLIVGARVRGKKHKHDGTNCDDWFAVELAGPWTIMAVADGAGSYRYSRVGARAACRKAVEVLGADLAKLAPRNRPSADGIDQRDGNEMFHDPELCDLQKRLYNTVQQAHLAVQEECNKRKDSAAHQRLVGRPLKVEDFSATLLVALHTRIRVGRGEQSLVLACQVGDGAIVAVDVAGEAHPLSLPDSGAFSGETDFVTSRRQIEPTNLARKTFVWLGPLRALMVMTDGVGDDYFPAASEMARLYADLVVNGILWPEDKGPDAVQVPAALDLATVGLDVEAETQTAAGPVAVTLRSAERLASALQATPASLAASPGLLRDTGWDAGLLKYSSASDRLRWWLDSYHVRGSFDDRTLVVLHRPRAS